MLDQSAVTLVTEIETLAFRAQPALVEEHYDGWRLRYANGYTGRANSVNPLTPSTLPLTEKLAHCRAYYAQHGLPLLFRLNNVIEPQLDAELVQHGFVFDTRKETQVMVADINAVTVAPLTYSPQPTRQWLEAYTRMNETPEPHHEPVWEQLNRIEPQACFARIERDNQTVAVALGVVDSGWLGVFDVVVAASHRQQGIGAELIAGLLSWGRAQGATRSYLQVLSNNHAARKLYDRWHYRPLYHYWYRVEPS